MKIYKIGEGLRPSPFDHILVRCQIKKILLDFYLLCRFTETVDIAVALYDKCA